MNLVTLTLKGVDEDYHILATTLSNGISLRTFDDLLRVKLIHYKQHLEFLKLKAPFPT